MAPRIRRSIRELEAEYHRGDRKALEDLIRAWKGIQELPPDDPNSFFTIAGYHGEPFRGAGWGNSQWWGGYCNHGNVLFPTWHHFDYTKHAGYKTVRYPFSGLVGDADIEKTVKHNEVYNAMSEEEVNTILNDNVQNWLGFGIKLNTGKFLYTGTREKYKACLDAPNYTVFSNTTSATQWNEDHFGVRKWSEAGSPTPATQAVVPLESPHNDMHLAIGGFDLPASPTRPGVDEQSFDAIADANGDMGENDTASFDPIFFFHHCFIDRMFWLWQQRHNSTKSLEIIYGYPGTNTVDSQGPTPGVAANTWLTMDSPLAPFDIATGVPFKSSYVVDIENTLKYTYASPPHSQPNAPLLGAPRAPAPPTLRVSGLNRAAISGSFVLSVYATLEGNTTPQLVGVESVLSRWHTSGCANCQNHLNVKAFVPLHGLTHEEAQKAEIRVGKVTRRAVEGRGGRGSRFIRWE
ncbi:hypothetical protein H2199_007119 [Coniosporium tulheliwenetii]|uniref:Uncharacterized protein n=1 Tax=Coniosporium tulheliwenetii TaxID=3383036 RepID=A0ACC2YSN7_9PEZI|nr:hypothetical protein H2199_007119 [Cladosporium sp. JES 115]